MPPSKRNGVAAVPATQTAAYVEREPLRTTAETIPYKVQGPDGEIVTLAGYRKGPATPIDVLIAYDEAIADSQDEAPTDNDRETMRSSRYYAKLMRSERLLRRGLLQAVVPGLKESGYENAVNVLASDDGPWREILTELGWWNEAPAEEADAGPEAMASGAAPIGPDALPDSSPVSDSTPSHESPAPA